MSSNQKNKVASSQGQQERRLSTRIPIRLLMREDRGEEFCYSHTADLSAGGVCLDYGLPHAPGTKVQLSFRLPGQSHEFQIGAEVVAEGWKEEHPITSLRFLQMSTEESQMIVRFIAAAKQSTADSD